MDLLTAGQAYFQHYIEPSAQPLLATSSDLQGTILPLDLRTLTHNTTGIPIIVARTKAEQIDDIADFVGSGGSDTGGMREANGRSTLIEFTQMTCGVADGASLFT